MDERANLDLIRDQLQRVASVERRYRELLLGNPVHPEGDALQALVGDGDFGVAWIAEPDENEFVQITSAAGAQSDVLNGLGAHPGEGLTGMVYQSGEIAWVDAYFQAESITHHFDSQMRQEQVRRLIAVPLIDEGVVVGVLAAGSRSSGVFGGVSVDHMVMAAGSVALQRVVAERERRLSRRVVVEERRRIALDLHDSVGAMLYSIGAGLKDINQLAAPGTSLSAADADRLHRLESQAAEASSVLRSALRVMYAPPAEMAVAAAIEADCRALQDRSGIEVRLMVMADQLVLPQPTTSLAARAVREALLNVEKHAGARNVAVTVALDGADATFTVADDGTGLVRDASDGTDGLGMISMNEAIERIGGSVELRLGDEVGTVWRLRVPTD